MLVKTVEIWPYGSKSKRRQLGTAKIWNDGTGSDARGNYKFTITPARKPLNLLRG